MFYNASYFLFHILFLNDFLWFIFLWFLLQFVTNVSIWNKDNKNCSLNFNYLKKFIWKLIKNIF